MNLTLCLPDNEDGRKAAESFLIWLCDAGGEQNYWDFADVQKSGTVFIDSFKYDFDRMEVKCVTGKVT